MTMLSSALTVVCVMIAPEDPDSVTSDYLSKHVAAEWHLNNRCGGRCLVVRYENPWKYLGKDITF